MSKTRSDQLLTEATETVSSFKDDILSSTPGRNAVSSFFRNLFCCKPKQADTAKLGDGLEVITLYGSIARDLEDAERYITWIKEARTKREDSALRKTANKTLETATSGLSELPDRINKKIAGVEQQLSDLDQGSSETQKLERQLTRLKDILMKHLPVMANTLASIEVNSFKYDALNDSLRGVNHYNTRP